MLASVSGQLPAQQPQRRMLSIHEHDAMDLLKQFGITVPAHQVSESAEDVFKIATSISEYSRCDNVLKTPSVLTLQIGP